MTRQIESEGVYFLSIMPSIEDFEKNVHLYELFVVNPGVQWMKTHKICCSICGHHWGILSVGNDVKVAFIKIRNVSVFDPDTNEIHGYMYWNDVPFRSATWDKDEQDIYRVRIIYINLPCVHFYDTRYTVLEE